MKILITGVAGFIGSNLADRFLKKGSAVVGIDDLSQGVRTQVPDGVEFHQMDIRSKDIYPLFRGVDAVYHLAARASLPDCHADPVMCSDINVTGTVNVFEAAKRAGIKKVIYAETSAVYEDVDKLPTAEGDARPKSFYAVSKLCTNYFADAYRRFFGMNFVALRYFNVYGPRQDYRRTIPPVMSAFIIKLLKGERPIIYGTGQKRRDFIHVDDVNDFHLLCLKSDKADNKIFNIGSGTNFSVLEIYDMICDLLSIRLEPIFKENLEWEAQNTLADISAAKSLGWSPKVDIREGLKGMIEYIRSEMKKGNI